MYGRSLIENDHGRVLKHGTRNGNALALAAGQMRSATADYCIKAFFKLADESGAAGFPRCLFDLRVGRIPASHAYVFAHGIVKQVVVLRDKGYLVVKLAERDLLQLAA